ncbi:MAG: CSLREA domain-containing protein, partial [Ardenticatenaceae bacterium]
MFKRYTSLLFPLLMTLLALALIVSQRTTTADAATITVNSTADVVADDGQCTLREAITAANTDSTSGTMAGECPPGSGDDTIMLSTESYTLTITGADEDSNATGDLDLTSDITIEVADGTATLDGNQLDRVLHVHDGATVSLSDLTITGGKTADGIDGGQAGQPGGDADHGGGIYNAGILT